MQIKHSIVWNTTNSSVCSSFSDYNLDFSQLFSTDGCNVTFIANIRLIVQVSVFVRVEVTNLTLFRIENTVIGNDIFIF